MNVFPLQNVTGQPPAASKKRTTFAGATNPPSQMSGSDFFLDFVGGILFVASCGVLFWFVISI